MNNLTNLRLLITSGRRPIDKIVILLYFIVYKFKRFIFYDKEYFLLEKFPISIQIKEKVFDKEIEIHYLFELISWLGIYESKDLLKILLDKKYFYLLDIGCNIGRLSFFFIFNKKQRKAILIDANPNIILAVSNFLKNNNLNGRAIAINKGISNRRSTLDFFYNNNFDLEGTFDENIAKQKELKNSMKIEVDTIDHITEKKKIDPNSIDLIKIDVEGMELKVLEGMKDFLSYKKRIDLIIEIWNKIHLKKVIQFLNGFEFSIKYWKLGPKDYFFNLSLKN